MPTVLNQKLYNKVKSEADKIYKVHGAYKSGWIVREYKKRGGTYANDGKPKLLKRWFAEKWTDIGNLEYPVYRPVYRVSKDTPLTVFEIDPKQARKQIRIKQKLKHRRLSKFKPKKR